MAARPKGRARKGGGANAGPARLWVPKLGMFLLRVFSGGLFLDAVYHKLWATRMAAPADGGRGLGLVDAFTHFVEHDYIPLVTRGVAEPPVVFGTTWTWFGSFLENVMLPGNMPYVAGPTILIFELLLGLSLVFGCCLRLMATLGVLLLVAFAMTKSTWIFTVGQTNWLLAFVLLAFTLTAAGRIWGLDAKLSQKLPGWVS